MDFTTAETWSGTRHCHGFRPCKRLRPCTPERLQGKFYCFSLWHPWSTTGWRRSLKRKEEAAQVLLPPNPITLSPAAPQTVRTGGNPHGDADDCGSVCWTSSPNPNPRDVCVRARVSEAARITAPWGRSDIGSVSAPLLENIWQLAQLQETRTSHFQAVSWAMNIEKSLSHHVCEESSWVFQ